MINSFSGRYAFLSNFYPCVIEHQGLKYSSVETFYVAMKADTDQYINGKYYTSGDFREMISKLDNPGLAKKIGRQVKLRKDWDSKKLEFMNWAVREKFKDESLKELLLLTGEQELVEGNWWGDTFWGVCNGKGQNNLGKILMSVRDEIRGTQKSGLESILKSN